MAAASVGTLEPATAADAGAVSAFLSEPLPGAVRLSIVPAPERCVPRRDHESRHHAIIVRSADGRVIAHGARTVYRMRVGGEVVWVGYIHGLRRDRVLAGDGRRLARGIALLAATRAEDEAPYQLTSILEDNQRARRVLEGGTPGAPRYEFIGGYRTAVVTVGLLAAMPPRGWSVRRCAIHEVDELQAFVDGHACDFSSVACVGSSRSDWFLLRSGSRLVGCVRLWDRRQQQRISVAGYGRLLALTRPLVNAGLWSTRRPTLPRPGSALAMAYAAHLTCLEADPALIRCLLGAAAQDVAHSGCDTLAIGLGDRHPLRPCVDRLPAWRLDSRLYVVGGRPVALRLASPEAALL